MTGSKIVRVVGWVLVGLCAAAALGLVLGFVVMWLWNWLMPVIFGLPVIGYWQAVGLFVLCHLLLKSPPGHHRGQHHGDGSRFRSRVKACMQHGAGDVVPEGGGEPGAAEPGAAG